MPPIVFFILALHCIVDFPATNVLEGKTKVFLSSMVDENVKFKKLVFIVYHQYLINMTTTAMHFIFDIVYEATIPQ